MRIVVKEYLSQHQPSTPTAIIDNQWATADGLWAGTYKYMAQPAAWPPTFFYTIVHYEHDSESGEMTSGYNSFILARQPTKSKHTLETHTTALETEFRHAPLQKLPFGRGEFQGTACQG